MNRTLAEWQAHFRRIYGRRNNYFISLEKRFTRLLVACRQLGETLRKDQHGITAYCLADVFAWLMAVANYFDDLPLPEAFAFKWSGSACSYCGKRPCECHKDRPPRHQRFNKKDWCVDSENGRLYGRTLRESQVALENIYGLANHQSGGVTVCLNRIFMEIGEMGAIVGGADIFPGLSVDHLEMNYALECADVISWLLSLANLIRIDLNQAIETRYFPGCPECRRCPCDCGTLVLEQSQFGTGAA
ncbi:MAG: hypothetical protein AAB505_02795 [Patescibacteria group bacterium]